MEVLTVRRSALHMWLLALAGVPMIVLGVDVLFRRRVVSALSSMIFNPNEIQTIEPRDVIWAVVLLAFGLLLNLFGLKELIAPRPVVKADDDGLHVQLGHLFARPVTIPWEEVVDVGSEQVNDSGDRIWVMWVRTSNPSRLPKNPWGARWIDPATLAILAQDWEVHPSAVALSVGEVAVNVARRPLEDPPTSPAQTAPVWQWEKKA